MTAAFSFSYLLPNSVWNHTDVIGHARQSKNRGRAVCWHLFWTAGVGWLLLPAVCALWTQVSLSCTLGNPWKRLGLTCDNTWGSSSVQVKSEKAFVSSEAGSIGALVAYCIFCNASVSQEWWFSKLLLALDKLSCGLSATCVCTKLKDCLCYKMLFVVLSYWKSILFCLAKCCYDLIPVKSVGQIVEVFFAWCKLH